MILRGVLREPMILLIGTVGCALAVLWPSPTPGLGRIESAAPSYNAVPVSIDQLPNVDSAMLALHQEARLALAQLQTGTDGGR